MRILASADHHFEASGARWAECLRIHAWIAEQVEELRPDLFLSGGDVYERASTPVEREAVADWLRRVAAVCPVVIAKGNHDRQLDVELLARLETRHPVIVEESVGVHILGGAAVAVVAWPNQAELAAGLAAGESVADAARAHLRDILRGLGEELAKHQGPRILLGHLQVSGSKVSTGQPLAPGSEVDVALADVALAGADASIFGHIHLPQDWEFDGRPIIYPGSPFRTSFGEAEEKSIVLVDIEDDDMAALSWRRIPTPAAPMLLIEAKLADIKCPEGDFRGLELDWAPEDDELPEAEIRLRYEVASTEREIGKRDAAEWKKTWLGRGAARVKIEERVIPHVRAREAAAEVAAATGIEAKLRKHWAASRPELSEEDVERLARLAADIEREVRA